RAVRADDVVAIVNTADDDEFHGLYVSPDLDSVTYTLAGASNLAHGWGLEGETFATLDALARYDVPTWFRLGDKALATHLFRTARLRAGGPLPTGAAGATRARRAGGAARPGRRRESDRRRRARQGPGRPADGAARHRGVVRRRRPRLRRVLRLSSDRRG